MAARTTAQRDQQSSTDPPAAQDQSGAPDGAAAATTNEAIASSASDVDAGAQPSLASAAMSSDNTADADEGDQGTPPAPGTATVVAPSLYGTGPDTLPGTGEGEDKQPPTWNAGIDAILAHHGTALSGPAVDFIRRALGELYQHQSGGPPASEVAKAFTAKVGDADWLNEQGREHQQTEGLQLNGRGIPLQQAVEITPADQGAPSPQAAEQERDPQLVQPAAGQQA